MPRSKTGAKVFSAMKDTYGGEKKAKEVFYASINAGKPGSSTWEGRKRSRKRSSGSRSRRGR